MTGILVALLVIMTAAFCFVMGMLFGAWVATAADPSKKEENK